VDAYRGVVLHTIHTNAMYYPWYAVSMPTRHVFVLSDTGTLLMVDDMTGRMVRTIKAAVGPPPTAYSGAYPLLLTVSPRGDQLWVTNPERQTLSVFAATTGTLLFTSHVGPQPRAVAADPTHGHLLVLCGGDIDGAGDVLSYGSVDVVDDRTGKVERTIQVGAAPTAMALDARTNRAFVLNTNVNGDLLPVHLSGRQGAGMHVPAGILRWIPFLPAAPATPNDSAQGSVTVLDTSLL
jgi:DNA-binding beta-propeller fold protein YncE